MWLRSRIANKDEHTQFVATILGKFEWEAEGLDLGPGGVPMEKAIPELTQTFKDIQIAFQCKNNN